MLREHFTPTLTLTPTLILTLTLTLASCPHPQLSPSPLTLTSHPHLRRFRGQGKRILAQERTAWHPDVHVRFQKKAWADDVLCEEVAGKEIAEATAEARAAGERSVVFFDNLSGQTTPEHLRALKWKAKADRHLLPTNTTSELMHIDDGIGAAFKNRLGTEMDAYLEGEGNLERWVAGPKEGGLQGWEKRVLVTNLAAAAWEKYNPYT